MFREYTLTAEQAVKEFGVEKVSADTAKKAEVDPDAPVTICHAICPRSTYAVGARWWPRTCRSPPAISRSTRSSCCESGYHEMPVIVPRWAVIPDSVYAIGPMFDALPDARELNEFLRMDRMNAELASRDVDRRGTTACSTRAPSRSGRARLSSPTRSTP